MSQPTDRPLPAAVGIERVVVGALLLDVPGTDDAIRRLEPQDFSVQALSCAFRRIKERFERSERPDLPTLTEDLSTHHELEKFPGKAGEVSALIDGIPRICHLLTWVETLKEKTLLRKHAVTASSILELAMSANGNGSDVLKEIAALSAPLREEVAQKRILTFFSGADLAKVTEEAVRWLVVGYVAEGAITELAAKVKAGKTTWEMEMLRAMLDGLDFLGKPTTKTAVVYLTEQPPVSFRQAMQRAGLLGREDFFALLHTDTKGLDWPTVVAGAVAKCKEVNAALLVVDTLAQFAGLKDDSENNAGAALQAMQPLQEVAARGIAVVIIRHERKAGGDVGDSGRGSSAFAGAVDIVLSLRRPEGNSKKTVRLLQALSRFSETPAEILIELTDQGYIALGEPREAALKDAKDSLLSIVPQTEAEAADLAGLVKGTDISRRTAQRAIDELLAEKLLSRIGKGKKGDPFRYFLPEKMPFCATSYIEEQKETIQDLPLAKWDP
jgi:hypothetical protein